MPRQTKKVISLNQRRRNTKTFPHPNPLPKGAGANPFLRHINDIAIANRLSPLSPAGTRAHLQQSRGAGGEGRL